MLGMTLLALMLATTIRPSAAKPLPPPSPVRGETNTSVDPVPGPEGAIKALVAAYRDLSETGVGATLTADYRFHSEAPRVARISHDVAFLDGWSREDEMKVAHGMFHGVSAPGRTTMPAADRVELRVDELHQGIDPEHPDSTDQYRLIYAPHATMRLWRDGRIRVRTTPSLIVYHVVRGDAAVLSAEQPADSSRWYIRRCLDRVDDLIAWLSNIQGDCGESLSAVPKSVGILGGPEPRITIHALRNPACPTLDIRCDLPESGPTHLDVFDVMGRRVAHQDFEVGAAGSQTVQAGAGAHLSPGAYWVRVAQTRSRPSTAMVIVAR